MPRHVDTEVRRREIVEATLQVLVNAGTRGLTFRAVANEMGGSTTLITHYFPTQKDLLDEVSAQVLALWEEEIQELDAASDDPLTRLIEFLHWMIPLDQEGLAGELSRIQLLSGQLLGDENRAMFDTWDREIRGYLRAHLTGLVPDKDVDRTVELLRVTANGVVLSVVERSDQWPPERQIAVVDHVLSLLGLTTSAARETR